jgi:uncharacterized membrane protein
VDKKRLLYGVMIGGGLTGLAASFFQTIEKMQSLSTVGKPLICDINSVFSCTNVLSAWQSSVFGFPNSLMCMILFTIFAAIGLAGLSGGVLPKKLRISIQALAIFTLCFGIWFLTQSIYAIGYLCILCLFCFAGLLFVNAAWLRINVSDLPIGARNRQIIARAIESNLDIFVWCLIAVAISLAALIRFTL